MKEILDGLSKLQMASIITMFVSGMGFAIERLGSTWGFEALAGQISETCAVVVMLASSILGGATLGKVAVKKAMAKPGEAQS